MFSGQIFADFAGYSNIARGTAYLLGYRLPVNFNAPYLAASFKNFWERWHITLSRWLRDYLYVPLGGNRRGRAPHLRQPAARDGARRAVARRGLHLHRLGRAARRRPGDGAAARPAPAIAAGRGPPLCGPDGSSSSRASCSRPGCSFAAARSRRPGWCWRNIAALDHWALGTMELVGLLFLLPIVGAAIVLVAARSGGVVMPLRRRYAPRWPRAWSMPS